MTSKFWQATSRYGLVRKASADSQRNLAGCLLVFVHGLFGDCRKTWRRMPEWVLENAAGDDLDVVSYAYPSKVWQRSSVERAADDLNTWLDSEFRKYRHLIFVTHSTGGLVVKQMLTESFLRLRGHKEKDQFDYTASSEVWLRARRVIHIAVPHQGGSRFSSVAGKFAYALAYPLMAPVLGAARFVTQGERDWGRNQIIALLRWRNPRLLELESRFLEQQKLAESMDLPSPLVHDIFAKSDLSVPFTTDAGQRNLYLRGTHGSVKVPDRPNAPIVSLVGEIVRLYRPNISLLAVDRTLARIAAVNKVTATETLIGDDSEGAAKSDDPVEPKVASKGFGTQTTVLERVLEAIQTGSEHPRQMVVTGSAGVGKSAVMRMIAWRLGRAYLNAPGQDNSVPLFIPLQQVTLAENQLENFSWEAIWQWWIDWIEHLYPDLKINKQWLAEQFLNSKTTIILDGLDDFLVNYPAIGLSKMITELRQIAQHYADNSGLSIIVGIRSGIHGLERLASDQRAVFEILRLSTQQAKQVFPKCRGYVDLVTDPGIKEFLLTPLILVNFEPPARMEFDRDSLSQSSIIGQTTDTIMARSGLIGMSFDGESHAETDDLRFALTIIAWLFFYQSRGEIAIKQLLDESLVIKQQWKEFLRKKGALNQAESLLAGFRLVEEKSSCEAIVRRTVFVNTGPDTIRFSHRSWQEYFLAQYLVQCIKFNFFEPLGVAAFHSRIYRLAGDAFRDSALSENCIRAALEESGRLRNTYISGNLIAFLTWTKTAIDTQALQLLLDQSPHYEALSRLVLIGGLGYRVLLNGADDYSLSDIRRALFPKLREYSDRATTPVDDPVLCSLTWCYQKAFSAQFSLPEPEHRWPNLGFDDSETYQALPMICIMQDGNPRLDERSRTLQRAFLTPIWDSIDDPMLAIRALHYLYYLIVAKKHGVNIVELSQELPELLHPGCEFEKVIESFTLVAELLDLYRACQNFYMKLETAAA